MLGWEVEPLLVFVVVSHGYAATLLVLAAVLKSQLFSTPDFSHRKYYLLMGWAPLSLLVIGLCCDWRYWPYALIAAIAGILGETLLSAVWMRFFDQPLWTYSYQAVLRGFTSKLNLLPWMIGAFLFVTTARLLGRWWPPPSAMALAPELVGAIALPVSALVVWLVHRVAVRRSGGDRRFTRGRFALFCTPIAITALSLAILCDPRFAVLMALFAIVGPVTEYAYGRTMAFFFERPLWTYNHWTLDHGHSSVVTIPLWALGGLYFHLIATRLGLG